MGFECISRTHVGLKRKINEDLVFADSERGLWAVADGMGGHEAGEVASGMVTEALGALPDGGDLDGLVAEGIAALQTVNGKLIDLARSIGERTDDRHDGGRPCDRRRIVSLLLGRRQPRLLHSRRRDRTVEPRP